MLWSFTTDLGKKQEQAEHMKEQAKTSNGKGKRSTTIAGNQLKSQMQSGKIPLLRHLLHMLQ